ncbi:hypothetical protein Tco_0698923 [Tanacetum coccineum]
MLLWVSNMLFHVYFKSQGNYVGSDTVLVVARRSAERSPAAFRAPTAIYEKDVDLEFVPAFRQVPAFEHGDLSLFICKFKQKNCKLVKNRAREYALLTDEIPAVKDKNLIEEVEVTATQQHGLVETSHVFAFREKNITQMNWLQEKTAFEKMKAIKGIHGPYGGNKWCTVAHRIKILDWSNALRRLPRGGAESSQFTDLMVVIRDVVLSDSRDGWKWALDSKGLFVASARKHTEEYRLHGGLTSTRWIRCVPIKVNVLT